jgi:ATP-binding protein involved in chromosome partitioning
LLQATGASILCNPLYDWEIVLENIKHIIAVASGKGGVGKSTTSVNLALAMVSMGMRVGLLDADIYGPSQPLMLGVASSVRPEQTGPNRMAPVMAHGVASMSMGYLVTDSTPMVWRGPMAAGALQQILTQTDWGSLDVLVIDLPPGTGDIQLTLAQKANLTGAVVVTTPQDIALLDAVKAVEMFRKVRVPVLGIVENMAVHICSQCGHAEHVFGEGGGQRMAEAYDTQMIGALPLDISIRQSVDQGCPSVVADPEGEVAKAYIEIAKALLARAEAEDAGEMPEFSVDDE